MPPRRGLVFFVEGEGDCNAVPALIKKVITDKKAWEYVALDKHLPFRIGDVTGITGDGQEKWLRYLQAAVKTRQNVGGILVILDGDKTSVEKAEFCAGRVARLLAQRAKDAGAGTQFSVAVVFACQEYESWLIAGSQSLSAKLEPRDVDLEAAPRGAKEFIRRNRIEGYKETIHQLPMTEALSLDQVRRRNLRSFRRLEKAVTELIDAFRTGNHVSTPAP